MRGGGGPRLDVFRTLKVPSLIIAGQSAAADLHLRSMSADLHYARAIVMLHEPSGQNLLLESGIAHPSPPATRAINGLN